MATIYSLDGFLIARIAQFLPSPLDTSFRATCKYTRNLLRAPVHRSRIKLAEYGARLGLREICELALSARDGDSINLEIQIAHTAAQYNHYDLCEFARARVPIAETELILHHIYVGAAISGHCEICKLARTSIRTYSSYANTITNMLRCAVINGHIKLVELILGWGHVSDFINYEIFIRMAAETGNLQMCEVIYARYSFINKQEMPILMFRGAVTGNHCQLIEYIIARIPREKVYSEIRTMFSVHRAPIVDYNVFNIFYNWACKNDVLYVVDEMFIAILKSYNPQRVAHMICEIANTHPQFCERHADALLQYAVETNSALCTFACEHGARPTYKHLARAVRTASIIALLQLVNWFAIHHARIHWSKLLVCAARSGNVIPYGFILARMKRNHVIRGPRASYATLLRATLDNQHCHGPLFNLILAQMYEAGEVLSERDKRNI